MSSAGITASNRAGGVPEKIVLVHPMGWGADFWSPVLAAADDSVALDAITLPGVRPEGGVFTVDAALRRIHEAVERAAQPVVIAGVSLGARLAIRYATAHPDRLSRLVLSGTGLSRRAPMQRLVARVAPESFITAMSARNTRSALMQQLAALRELDTAGDLARLKVPATVVCAADDRGYLPQSRRAAALAGQELIEVDHGGHHWPNTRPELFLDVLKGALSRV